MKTLLNLSLVLTLAAFVGCSTTPDAQTSKESAKTEAGPKPPAVKPSKPKNFVQQLMDLHNDLNKRRVSTAVAVEEFLKFRDAVAGTNPVHRAMVEVRVLDRFKTAGVQDLADKYVPLLCKPVVSDMTRPLPTRLDYAESYCRWLCGEAKYDEADKIAESLIFAALHPPKGIAPTKSNARAVQPRPDNNSIARAYLLKAGCRRWRDDADGAIAAAKEAMKYNLITARNKVTDYAFEYDRPQLALELWKDCDTFAKLCAFQDRRHPELVRDLALSYMLCPTNPPVKRSEILNRYIGIAKTPEAYRVRAALKDVYCQANAYWWVRHEIVNLYLKGDWAHFVEMYEYTHFKSLDTPGGHRGHVFALAASGQKPKALAKADEYLKDEKLDRKERAKLGALRALVAGTDALVPLAALKDDPKAYAEAVRKTATWCLNLQQNDECRRYTAAYQALVKPQPKRRYDIKWFDTPVTSISDWRRVWDQLEKTLVNYKMTADLDNLVTDVSTGRVKTETTDKDSVHARFEVTALCDVKGLSIFLRVADPNARLVEKGLAGGLCTEMYLAAGDNQPYLCFGSEPREGLCFSLQTAYESMDYKRLNVKGPRDRYSLQTEVAFTDSDYVLRLFFPWDAFYQKLPKAGTEWKYECLNFFGPDGNFSWAGSKFIHESSSWGRLVFSLTPAQQRAIKRRLIYSTYKSWNVASHGEVAPFDKWADPVIGDPEFYQTIKPLETELLGYQKRVKADMSEADVDEVYEKGVIRWLGIRHELDKLRAEYLISK